MKILAPSAAPSKNTLAQKVLCAFSGKSYSGAPEDKEGGKKKCFVIHVPYLKRLFVFSLLF